MDRFFAILLACIFAILLALVTDKAFNAHLSGGELSEAPEYCTQWGGVDRLVLYPEYKIRCNGGQWVTPIPHTHTEEANNAS